MKSVKFSLIFVYLLLISFSGAIKIQEIQNSTASNDKTLNITITSENLKFNLINFYAEYDLPSPESYKLNIRLIDDHNKIQNMIGFSIIQVHSMMYNVSFEQLFNNETFNSEQENQMQYGTNLGFIIENENIYNNTAEFIIQSLNYYSNVKIAVILIVYSINASRPGGCEIETKFPTLTVTEENNFIDVYSPPAAPPKILTNNTDNYCNLNSSKSNIVIKLESYYMYLPKGDFSSESYFNGIKMMLNDIERFGIKENILSKESKENHRTYIGVPGTGLVLNTIASIYVDDLFLQAVSYVPAVTYSCETTASKICSVLPDILVITIISWALIIIGLAKCFDKTSMVADSVITSVYIFYKIVKYFDIEDSIGIYSILILCILCIWYCVGVNRSHTVLRFVFTFLSNLILSSITSNLILYQTSFYFLSSASFWIIFSVSFFILSFTFCQPNFAIIINIIYGSFYFMFGCLFLNKSNLSLIVANSQINLRNLYIANRMPSFEIADIIIFGIGILLITIGFCIKPKNVDVELSSLLQPAILPMDSNEVF